MSSRDQDILAETRSRQVDLGGDDIGALHYLYFLGTPGPSPLSDHIPDSSSETDTEDDIHESAIAHSAPKPTERTTDDQDWSKMKVELKRDMKFLMAATALLIGGLASATPLSWIAILISSIVILASTFAVAKHATQKHSESPSLSDSAEGVTSSADDAARHHFMRKL